MANYDIPNLDGLDLPAPVAEAYDALLAAQRASKSANAAKAEARRAYAAAPDEYAAALRAAANADLPLADVEDRTHALEEALSDATRYADVQADLVKRRWWDLHTALTEHGGDVLAQAQAASGAAVATWRKRQAAAERAATDAAGALAQHLDVVRVLGTQAHAPSSNHERLPDLPPDLAGEYVEARARLASEIHELVDAGRDERLVRMNARSMTGEWRTTASEWRSLQRSATNATDTLRRLLSRSLVKREAGPSGSFD